MEVPEKLKTELPQNPAGQSGYKPKGNENRTLNIEICTFMLTIAETWKQAECPRRVGG